MRSALGLFLLSLRLLSQTPTTPQEWARDSDAIFRGNAAPGETGNPAIDSWRICDLETGAPLPDARAWKLFTDPAGVSRFELVPAERDAIIRLPAWSNAYVEAPGYAPLRCNDLAETMCGTYRHRNEQYRWGFFGLVPAFDTPIEVRDWLDRPLTGARVDVLCLDAGPYAPIRSAVTDAQGRCVLRSVNLEHAGLAVFEETARLDLVTFEGNDDWRSHRWRPGQPPLVVHVASSGPTMRVREDDVVVAVQTSGLPTDEKWDHQEYVVFADGMTLGAQRGELDAVTTVRVPARGRCAVHLSVRTRTKVVEIPESARLPGAEPVRVKWFDPAPLMVRLVDTCGRPVEGWAQVFHRATDDIDFTGWDAAEIPTPERARDRRARAR